MSEQALHLSPNFVIKSFTGEANWPEAIELIWTVLAKQSIGN
jgi:hypothetical protein